MIWFTSRWQFDVTTPLDSLGGISGRPRKHKFWLFQESHGADF